MTDHRTIDEYRQCRRNFKDLWRAKRRHMNRLAVVEEEIAAVEAHMAKLAARIGPEELAVFNMENGR
jgi:hypothetical protein